MRKIIIIILLFGGGTLFVQAQDNLKLWYEKPASQWTEALPIGNGQIGGMVFGGIEEELIQLNEGTLWSGGPQKKNVNPEAHTYLQSIRNALAKEDYQTASDLSKKMQGHFSESFLPLGDLHLTQDLGGKQPTNYYRDLDLNRAVSTTRFSVDGVEYTREVFVSAPDSVMVLRILSSKPNRLNIDLSLSSQLRNEKSTLDNKQLIMQGKAPVRVDPTYYNPKERESIEYQDAEGCNGMRFQVRVQPIIKDGSMVVDTTGIHITDASEIVVYLSAATSFNGFDKCPDSQGRDEKAISARKLTKAISKDYENLYNSHINDYKSYFNRVSLKLNDPITYQLNEKLPSDLRLKIYSCGFKDSGLEVLYFQYGRYLLISSSREGGSAANLQGIWNKELRPPWSSNYTTNINAQMNYWPAESANLSEMHKPLLNLIGDVSKTGKVTAQEYYKTRGWVVHHNSDIWGLSNAVGDVGNGDPVWANWYMGGNWLCLHLWEHYAYTRDKEFLRNYAYPIMKDAALFCIDWLFEKDGYLVTAPSTSPENEFKIEGKNYAVTTASTMDMAIIWDLFTNIIQASEELNIDASFRNQLISKRAKLLPYQVGAQGQLQEWDKDFEENDPHHRHVSHLYGLHPGRQISPLSNTKLTNACKRTLEIRGDGGTGWSKAWKINFWCRLLDGNHAYKLIRDIMKYSDESAIGGAQEGGTFPNFFDAHPPFQIDGNFGATAGFIEMLMQSHLNEIHLLPALPDEWESGEIKGIKARGNFEVDIEWTNKSLSKAKIKSVLGNKCIIRSSSPITIDGLDATSTKDKGYFLTSFETKKGESYFINAK